MPCLRPFAVHGEGGDVDPLAGLPPANAGALEGVTLPPRRSPPDGGGADVPTGGRPSPLLNGATPFSQRLLLFEEFGTQPIRPRMTTFRVSGAPSAFMVTSSPALIC